MSVKVQTWLFFRGKESAENTDLAAVTVSASEVKAVPVSQFIELRDRDGNVFATITWPSTTSVRKTRE